MPERHGLTAECQQLLSQIMDLGPGSLPFTRAYLESYILLNMGFAEATLRALKEPYDWVGHGLDPSAHIIEEQQQSLQWYRAAYAELDTIADEALTDWWAGRLGLADEATDEGKGKQ
jgi:hypothetical protein